MRELMAQSPNMPFRPAVLLYLACNRPNAMRRKQLAEMSALPGRIADKTAPVSVRKG